MRSLLFFSLICALLACARLELATDLRYHSDHPNKCVFKNFDLVIEGGETVPHPKFPCCIINCGNGGIAEIVSCGYQITPVGCVLEDVNKNKPYPECCYKQVACYD